LLLTLLRVTRHDFLEKATWTLAIALLILCLAASLSIPHQTAQGTRSAIEQQIQNAVDPSQVPQFPTIPQGPTGGEN